MIPVGVFCIVLRSDFVVRSVLLQNIGARDILLARQISALHMICAYIYLFGQGAGT